MAETVRTFPEQIQIKRQLFNLVNNTESRIAMSSCATTIRPTRIFYEQAGSCLLGNESAFLQANYKNRTMSYDLEHLNRNDDADITLAKL